MNGKEYICGYTKGEKMIRKTGPSRTRKTSVNKNKKIRRKSKRTQARIIRSR